MDSDRERIEIGSVGSVNPARRELRVSPEHPYERALTDAQWIRVVPRGGKEIRCRVAGVEVAGGIVVVTLAPGVLRDTVAGLRGAAVVARPEELNRPTLEDLTLVDALGFDVIGPDGERIGTLAGLFETPAHPILEIERENGITVLVPGIEEVVADIQWERKRVVVNDIAPYGVEDAD
jgi:ribosomal 30S subunit maturation factor RimM